MAHEEHREVHGAFARNIVVEHRMGWKVNNDFGVRNTVATKQRISFVLFENWRDGIRMEELSTFSTLSSVDCFHSVVFFLFHFRFFRVSRFSVTLPPNISTKSILYSIYFHAFLFRHRQMSYLSVLDKTVGLIYTVSQMKWQAGRQRRDGCVKCDVFVVRCTHTFPSSSLRKMK